MTETEQESCGGQLTAGSARRDFRLPGTPVRWPPDREADVRHIRLDLNVNPEKRTLRGTATLRFAPVARPLRSARFDLAELTVDAVTSGGKSAAFHHEGGVLTVTFDRPLPPGRETEMAITYHGSPRVGLNFTGPDRDYPDRPYQAWTQGQDEYAHYWFPCHDFPDQRSTTEVVVTAPAGYDTVSNGRLVEVRRRGGSRTWHWRQEIPHVAYLVSLVVGKFESWEEDVHGVPLQYYVPPGRRADAERIFRETPHMIETFEGFSGEPYPYAKYAQVVVQDFTWGGMENTSATTLIDETVPDDRALPDSDWGRLVSHELAHQWFGDLITCREWAHAWLNEGFATFAWPYWAEKRWGVDEAQRLNLVHRQVYFSEDAEYRRAIVARTYIEPFELFDSHIYEKGGLVLWMLRDMLGHDLFEACVKEYMRRHRVGLVVTEDLVRAFEDVSGKSLGWFFDQWVYGGGHPEFEVRYAWDDKTRIATVAVKQKQKVDSLTHLFRMPLRLAFGQPGRKTPVVRDVEVGLDGADDAFTVTLAARPTWVRFDHQNRVLKTLDFDRPEELLRAQLAEDELTGRIEAAESLGKLATPTAVEALERALNRDPFWAGQAAAARALGAARTDAARAALVRGLAAKSSRVRTAVATALGSWREDEEVAAALARTIVEDSSYNAAGAAATSLGKLKTPGAAEILRRAVETPSYRDIIASGAINGLVALRDAANLASILEQTMPPRSSRLRAISLEAAARLARELPEEHRPPVREAAEAALHDPLYFVRRGACAALQALGDDRAIPALRAVEARDIEGAIRYAARVAVLLLMQGRTKEDELNNLKDEVEKLRRSGIEMKERVEKLEAADRRVRRPARRR
ncbi:MAG TPA: M1 family aminopeptidase [Candidatus Dormibacteraeota bacterium]|nr:M1 family aminopeptidase [Candidatus Dormibacteraeota bacterium]